MSNGMVPNSFVGRLKHVRSRFSMLPISGSGAELLRGMILEFIDVLILEAGEEYQEQFVAPNGQLTNAQNPQGLDPRNYTGPVPGSSQFNPMHTPDGVRMTQGSVQRIQPTQEPVVMIPAGGQPVAERPSIIAQPPGTAPHVQLSQVGNPTGPGIQHLPPGFPAVISETPTDVQHLPPAPMAAPPGVELLDHALPMIPPGGQSA